MNYLPRTSLALAAALAASLATAPMALAQACHYLPSNTPTTGTPDPRPFGNGNGNDPTYGDMRYQIQVPAAALGNQPTQIFELFVAPAGSHMRTFTELAVRMGHNPNGTLGTQMAFNMVGFTATPVQYNDFSFQADADQWVPLGMTGPFQFDPQYGDLVLEFRVRDAAVLPGGSGDVGLRTDPSIPFVWTSGLGYNGTLVAGGGIKVRLCTDHYGTIEYPFGGCAGSNSLRPHLTYGGTAQIGGTLQVQLSDALPIPNLPTILVFSTVPRVGPFVLDGIGMTGCTAHVFGNFIFSVPSNGGSATFSLPLPATLPPGIAMWNQWACFDLTANPLGLSLSNVGRFMIGNTQ